MDEQQAIARLKNGDITGLELLVKLYSVQAVRASYLITGDKATAEDIVQEAFLRAYQRIDQFDDSRPFAPWFIRSVVNDSVKVVTKNKTIVSFEAESGESSIALEEILPSDIDELDQVEMQQAVWDALGKLSASQRVAVILRYYFDFSEVEAAEVLSCPPNTLKWWTSQARIHLRALLAPLRPSIRQPKYSKPLEKEIES